MSRCTPDFTADIEVKVRARYRRGRARVIRSQGRRVLPHVRPTTWTRARSALGTLLGALTLVGGLTWLLLNWGGLHRGVDVTAGLVYTAGGLVLLMPHRVHLPGRLTTTIAAGAGLTGTLAGLAAGATQACCTYVYATARGFPFHWLQRGAIADDPETARRLALGADWHADGVALAGDVLFWAYVGLLIVAVVQIVRAHVPARTGVPGGQAVDPA